MSKEKVSEQKMPYGKYKGQSVKWVLYGDASYLKWFMMKCEHPLSKELKKFLALDIYKEFEAQKIVSDINSVNQYDSQYEGCLDFGG
jgi:uncharacterized protein (DUF3820 family)